MNFKNTQSAQYLIAKAIFTNGPLSVERIIQFVPEFTLEGLRSTVGRMCFGGDLQKTGEAFDVVPNIRRHFASQGHESKIAESRTFSVHRPLSAKYIISREAPRADAPPLRDMSFKTGSIGFPAGHWI